MTERTLLVFGLGYSALAIAQRLRSKGWRVIGTTRDPEKARTLEEVRLEMRVWPGDDLTADIAAADHLLVSAAPGPEGDPFLAAYGEALQHASFRWIGYLSTTGVYGDRGGAAVDEGSALQPTTKRGQWRQEAEAGWTRLAEAAVLPLAIFRLAGIYGPGRGPFAKVKSGSARRIVKPGQVFSRIHVEDIATVVCASVARPEITGIFNVCDDLAAPPQDVIAYAAELLGLPVPKAEAFESAEMSAMARSFYGESKVVRNNRIKEALDVALKYPTYREGLQALLERE